MDARYLHDKEELKQSSQAVDEDRRNFLTAGLVGGAVAAGALVAGAAQAQQVAQAPALTAGPWWPHPKWGKDDVAGASNWITPAKVLDAVKWIKDGKIYRIGRVYESGMPKFGERAFTLRIPGSPTGGPFGTNKLVYHDEYPRHRDRPDRHAVRRPRPHRHPDGQGRRQERDALLQRRHRAGDRRCLRPDQARHRELQAVLHARPSVRRRGGEGRTMDAGQEITVADLRSALQKQNMQEADIKEGDAVFFNTGWGKLWMKNNDKFNSGEPGIGLEVAKWCIDKGVCLTGADQWATEVVPNPNKDLAFPVHAELIRKNGIYNHENLDFTGLIADRKYQFVYIFSPAPIKGATGSNGGPIAVT